jgi:hypothetical protein
MESAKKVRRSEFRVSGFVNKNKNPNSNESFRKGLFLNNKEVRSIVITGYGTHCEMEMAHACRLAGLEVVDIVHINELIVGK